MTTHEFRKKVTFVIVSLFLLGVGWYGNGWYRHDFEKQKDRRVKLSGFQFISPLLDVELPEGYNIRHEPIPFKYKIKKFVDLQINSGKVQEMSVYYRDLLDGPWFGINEKVKYDAASMMKVPTMIGWLKRAEKDPAVLQRRLAFNAKTCPCPAQGITPAQSLKDGASYTVDELLRYMICFSDNKAMWLLHSGISDEEYGKIMENMDVTNDPSEGHNFVTVHGYSGFLRILYNASYLSKEMSEKALQLLSFQDFPYGIVAGVPQGIKVASKFGEFVDDKNPDVLQLHEFGIVYHPNGAYILGILTSGHDLAKQADILKSVSEMVYKEVNSNASANN